MNKRILTVLAILFCANAQTSDQYPGLTNNYDSVWRTNMNELRSHYKYLESSPLSRYLKDIEPSHITKNITPINFNDIKKPVHSKFVRADKYFNKELIYKSIYKIRDNEIVYILKDRVEVIMSKGSLSCEYKIQLWPDDNKDDKYYNNILPSKDFIIDKLTSTGGTVEAFIESEKLLGLSITGNTSGGMSKVLIDGRAASYTAIDCNNSRGKNQMINDLTEWAELLIEANN